VAETNKGSSFCSAVAHACFFLKRKGWELCGERALVLRKCTMVPFDRPGGMMLCSRTTTFWLFGISTRVNVLVGAEQRQIYDVTHFLFVQHGLLFHVAMANVEEDEQVLTFEDLRFSCDSSPST
jgi:hypothetical protein